MRPETKLIMGEFSEEAAEALWQDGYLFKNIQDPDMLPYKYLGPEHVNVTRILFDADIRKFDDLEVFVNKYNCNLNNDDPVTYGITNWDE